MPDVVPKQGATGWTGGQYSLVRAALGVWLAGQFAALWPAAVLLARTRDFRDDPPETIWTTLPSVFDLWSSPLFAQGVLVVGVLLALALAIGRWDRLAAVLAWYLWATCYAREPALVGPAFPLLSWMLAVHVATPPAPYGAWDASGRIDPRGAWQMPTGVYVAVWGMLTAIYLVQAGQKVFAHGWQAGEVYTRLSPGLPLPHGVLLAAGWGVLAFQVLFGPLALWPKARPVLWLCGVGLTLAGFVGGVPCGLVLGLFIAHLLAIDPAWIAPRATAAAAGDSGQEATDLLFYDGHCGLCQRSVRLILAEDRTGRAFRFSPLGSQSFLATIPERDRAKLPDSMIVRQPDGTLLTRSTAALHILGRLGGLWLVLGLLLRFVPRPLSDLFYAGIARVRHQIFGRPTNACPIIPADLRARFDLA